MPWRAAVAEMLGCVDVPRSFPPSTSFQPDQWMMMHLDGWPDLTAAVPGDASMPASPSSRKRKAESPQAPEVNAVNAAAVNVDKGEKRVRGAALHHPKQEPHPSPSNSSGGGDNSKPASEVVQKPDYVHVRARRGQATDSHSLAERARREKISERMKYLQDLVPGCSKITGKAGMLDEIINYVQSLQRQVEFLSMKLATVNPVFEFGPHELPVTVAEASACPGGAAGVMPMPAGLLSMPLLPPATLSGCGALNLQDLAFDAAIGMPDFSMDARFNAAGSPSLPWDAVLQSLLAGDLGPASAAAAKAYRGAA